MAAAASDLFKKLTNNFSTTLSGAIVGAGDTSMSLGSTTNLPTDTGIVLVIDRVNASGVATPTLREYVKGTVSGSTIINLVRGVGNSTAQAHLSGAVVEQVVDQSTWNDAMSGVLAHANQDGSLITAAVQTALGLGTGALNGWNPLANTPNTVVYNGNRSYTCTFNSVDLTPTLSAGMRFRSTRTVAAPTQSTSLNGTTQYWSKTAPAGITFNNNYTASAWVKLSSYPAVAGTVQSRFDGTNGWKLDISSAGQVRLISFNGAAGNFLNVSSYQSIPLNKWVHVAAQTDMTVTTNTPTTNYIMIDGVDVPAIATRSGTSPTALVQAGAYQVGADNSTNFFPGKIAQVAIYSAKVTQATIQSYYSQGLAGTEPTLISAFAFNGSATDLNTTNNNSLTANGSAGYTTDAPWTVQANGVPNGTQDHGILQSTVFTGGNTVTVVQAAEGCTIPTSGGISAVAYSSVKVPYNFPAQRGKWELSSLLRSTAYTTRTIGSVYEPSPALRIVTPIGAWELKAEIDARFTGQASTFINGQTNISSNNTTVVYPSTDGSAMTAVIATDQSTSGNITAEANATIIGQIEAATATNLYVLQNYNTGTGSSSTGVSSGHVKLVNSYL